MDIEKDKTHFSVANAGRVIWALIEDVAITTVALQVSMMRHKNNVWNVLSHMLRARKGLNGIEMSYKL